MIDSLKRFLRGKRTWTSPTMTMPETRLHTLVSPPPDFVVEALS